MDMVTISSENGIMELLFNKMQEPKMGEEPGVNLMLDVKQHEVVARNYSERNPHLKKAPDQLTKNDIEIHTDKTTEPVLFMALETTNPDSLLT